MVRPPTLSLPLQLMIIRVEPIIYRSLALTRRSVIEQFYRTMTDPNTNKTAEFLSQHVKYLCATEGCLEAEVIEIIKTCKGVQVLSIWALPYFENDAMRQLFASSHLCPSRMYILAIPTHYSSYPTRCRVNFSLAIFQNLTHLHIVCSSEEALQFWDNLSSMSNLTHLSVDHVLFGRQIYAQVARDILSLCPTSLCIFVIWIPPPRSIPRGGLDEVRSINQGDVDPRAIVASHESLLQDPFDHYEYALYHPWSEVLPDWTGKNTGKDFWELAEDIVARRRDWLQTVCPVSPSIGIFR